MINCLSIPCDARWSINLSRRRPASRPSVRGSTPRWAPHPGERASAEEVLADGVGVHRDRLAVPECIKIDDVRARVGQNAPLCVPAAVNAARASSR